ncbi:influenza virus NS1A binding protein, partial [Cichlidogyrus casuarinus]
TIKRRELNLHSTTFCRHFTCRANNYSQKTESVSVLVPKWPEDDLGGFCAALVNGAIHVIGGAIGIKAQKSHYMLPLGAKEWQHAPDMGVARQCASCIVVDRDIYVIGGDDSLSNRCLASCEVFNTVTGEWRRNVPDMIEGRCHFALSRIGDAIFVFGGWNGENCLSTCERYNLEENQWSVIQPMKYERYGCSASTFRNQIFVVGGWGTGSTLKAVEMYDVVSNQWSSVADLKKGHSYCAIYSDGRETLLVAGGLCMDGPSDTMERFDAETGEWILLPQKMLHPINTLVNPQLMQ